MIGAGKYDDLCTIVREKAEAIAALVIVIGGNKGPGFSAQMPPQLSEEIPKLLRGIADEIEKNFREEQKNAN